MKLNIGAGEQWSHARVRGWPDWIDIDIRLSTRPSLVADIRRLPFADQSVTAVYAGHVIEHLDLPDVGATFHELRRVLSLDGRLLVVGPDIHKGEALLAAGAYQLAEGESPAARVASLGVSDEPEGDPCLHHWECDPGTIVQSLRVAGFVDVAEIPMGGAITRSPHWPVYDRETQDQFAVIATRS